MLETACGQRSTTLKFIQREIIIVFVLCNQQWTLNTSLKKESNRFTALTPIADKVDQKLIVLEEVLDGQSQQHI